MNTREKSEGRAWRTSVNVRMQVYVIHGQTV